MYCPGCPVRQQLGGGQGLRAFFRPLCVCSIQVMIERCLMHPLLLPIVLIAFLFCIYLARIPPASDCQCKQLRIAYICDIATLFLTPSFPPSPIRSKSLSFWQRFQECDTCREAGHPTSQQCHDTLPKHAASACTVVAELLMSTATPASANTACQVQRTDIGFVFTGVAGSLWRRLRFLPF